ncbi:hypothetical protein JVU11DRAFT_5350 [Chiua virens]|nr:hypothetical protein JVU11DRAFT_5350 [Chiua virens]
MATTTMHFGPEWMRAKPQPPARQQQPPSPPPQAQQLGTSTYSALVTPVTQELDKRDESHPFRYTKEEMFRIYKEGGGRGGLNLEVERWEGIVRDVASEPASLREMSEAEKKLFAGPLNSELRRRQSTDLMNSLSSPSDRQRLSHSNSAANNTMRYGSFLGRRRDSTDQPPLSLPRKLSISNTQGATLTSPRDALPSPRNRMGAFGSGFDGVLNNGDAWSKRRPPAGATGAGGGVLARGDGREEDARRSEIKEEEESGGHHSSYTRDSDAAVVTDRSSSPGPGTFQSDVIQNNQVSSSEFNPLDQSMASMSLEGRNETNSNARISPTTNPLPLRPPPGLTDPASIEWSYLDPQGQVQGPFRADLMQKWFDEGYFTADLRMKRTHIDTDWIAVGMLESRAAGAGGQIFLSHISPGPPGLAAPRTSSPKGYSPIHEQSTFNGYHPIPTQTLRPTLDPYLNGSSPADSPSSSLGGGRFGNGSPDPSTFDGRTGSSVYSNDPNFGGRTVGGRAALQDPMSDARTLDNNIRRAPSIDTFNVYNASGDNSPWSAGVGEISQGLNDSDQRPYSNGFNSTGACAIGNPLSVDQNYGDTTYDSLSSHHDPTVPPHPSDTNGMLFNGNIINGLGSQFGVPTQFPQSSSAPYVVQHRQSVSPLQDLQTSETPNVTRTPTSAVQPNGPSPWTARTRPFEYPIIPSPVVPPARPQVSEWITPQPVGPSPWLMASLPVVEDVWREMPGPNSLTFSNLGQHNKLQQQEEEEGTDDIVVSPVEDDVPVQLDTQPAQAESTDDVSASATTVASHSATPASTFTPTPVTQTLASKARRKSTARDLQAPASKVAAPPPATTIIKEQTSASAAPAVQSKPAWIIDDDSKKQKGTGMTSLREIQEAEVRKAEARKAAEKERERLSCANATSPNSAAEESQTFTSSWGLPTSQAGARNVIPPKETAPTGGPISATPAAPVWSNTSPAPTAKKTMKEIQEEEERRKKLAVRDNMATAAARRAYAETTVKVVPSAQASSSPWTTVGPNGKPSPPTNTPRPTVNTNPASSNPAPAIVLRPNGTPARQAATTTVKVATPRVEDFPVTPSHDFLKWLGESLKGLNSSVNLEDITSMLLSFPLDPDQSTTEIISDLIYASSTTLDGRRFASEFVNKRKVDAATRRGTASASGSSNKPVSIADVVKTQPKPVQQEWGFKVVNKKKKGGRS